MVKQVKYTKYVYLEGENMTKQLLTFKEANEYLGFKSPASLRECINQGLPFVQVANSKKIDIDDLKAFIKEHKISKTTEKASL